MSDPVLTRRADFLNWEFGVFFHFGIRTYFKGHTDWDNRPMPAEAFNPVHLDCEQWIRESHEAGATYAILVCKHHDGFANWPTKYSDYSVAHTPWKNGQGDVVREFTSACRKYNMKVGLYYSPAQWGGAAAFSDEKAYDDYFIAQITELLTDYGKIDYLWFDGCGSENHQYDQPRIVSVIRSLQPDILLFNMWDPDTAWIGNEDGYAPLPNSNWRSDVDFSMFATEKEQLDAVRFLPAECDCKLRSTWFDCEYNEDTIKSLPELVGMYEMSVGRGANFLLNLGPGEDGRLPEKDVMRLRELGAEIRRRYGTPLAEFSAIKEEGDHAFSIEADAPVPVDRVVLTEDVLGSEVTAFRIYAHLPTYQKKRICVYQGSTIGHKAICIFPAIRTARLTVETEEARPAITSMQAYCVK